MTTEIIQYEGGQITLRPNGQGWMAETSHPNSPRVGRLHTNEIEEKNYLIGLAKRDIDERLKLGK